MYISRKYHMKILEIDNLARQLSVRGLVDTCRLISTTFYRCSYESQVNSSALFGCAFFLRISQCSDR